MPVCLPDLIVFDFDGVLTDNRVLVLEDGREGVFCNRSDGLGFDLLRKAGVRMLIVSTERNPVVSIRARKISVPCLQDVADKCLEVVQFCAKERIELARVMYVGNDMNDFAVMQRVGLRVCPADAHPAIQSISNKVLSSNGGAGVVREIAEQLLQLEYDTKTAVR